MSKRRQLKPLEVAYQNLEKLGPWGEDSIMYSLFHTEENFKKTGSKQFKSADCSPRKTYNKELPQMQTQTVSPRRSVAGGPTPDGPPHIPRTNVEDYFNKKPDKKLNTLTKKLIDSKTISNFKSLPLLKVRRELQIQRKVYVMSNRQAEPEPRVRIRSQSKTSFGEKEKPMQRRKSEGQPTPKKLLDIGQASKTQFSSQFGRMLKIIDEMSREDPVWACSRRPVDTNNV